MCGIAGAIALSAGGRPSAAIVRALVQGVAHRGPNGEGLWVSPSGRAILGHRRLSVIDLATGQQPMTSTDGGHGLVFNGEIYNYLELRAALAVEGAEFRTQSDTEVLHLLLQREGARALTKLRGMFAFATWDDARGMLMIARDRIGKKPFYYLVQNEVLYFASALRALRRAVPGAWEIDPAALDQYFTFGFIPAPATIYRGVYKLPAAHVAVNGPNGLEARPFWSLAAEGAPFTGSYAAALNALEAELRIAVTIRLRSDVPLGVYLSGGIDSSLVTALAAQQATTQLDTFSVGFAEAEFDETTRAADVAARLGVRHHIFRADSGIRAALPTLAAHFGEPNADWSALPMWLLAEETRKHVTVALGGDGGDEGYAGYQWYRNAARIARYSALLPPGLAGTVSGALRHAGAGRQGRLGKVQRGLEALSAPDDAERFALLRTLFGAIEKERLYCSEYQALLARNPPAITDIAAAYRAASGSALRRMRYADQHFYLADDLMPKVDVTSMAFGLEVRAPLLDQEVQALAMSLPDAFLQGEAGGKRILRDLLARLVPGLAIEGPKRGFTPPVARWLKGDMRARLIDLPAAPLVRNLGWLRAKGVADLVAEHLSGRRDHGARLYALLMLDEWVRIERPEAGQADDIAIAG
jgi:asparagine synthase (glutamine-hydrolysing)